MRFVHSGDWQIGMQAVHAGEAAPEVRRARLRSASRVVEVAREHAAEFILLAGDTFEGNTVGRELVAEVARILASASCPVYLIPGNHDPFRPGSVWDHGCWSQTGNVHILRAAGAIAVPGGTLYPCPLTRKQSSEDPTAWIPDSGGDGIRIGLAHGNMGELIGEEGGFPIAFDAPSRKGLDYLALGHWHSTVLFAGGRMAYSGTHEATKFGEKDSGNVLLVDIGERGAKPVITKQRTGLLEWEQVEETITEPGRLAEVSRRLSAGAAKDRLVDVKLSGQLFERDCAELDRIRETLRHYLHGRIDDTALRPAPCDDDWINLLPAGVAQYAAHRLRELAKEPGEPGAVATQALRELYALQSEVRA